MRLLFLMLLLFALLSQMNAASVTFTTSQTFIVPNGVNSVKVLVIGGGGGGANGHQGGGGAGYLATGVFTVTSGQSISVVVGQGGHGGLENASNTIAGLTAGTASSFGSYLSAGGGLVVTGINQTGNNGSSGGGGSGNGGYGAAGGMGGSNGYSATYAGGIGQGSYISLLTAFTENSITAGSGGAGGQSSHGGGGGGGGILINGLGISGQNGAMSWSGKGGIGYGGGGGGGGYNGGNRVAGGNGASGLVYIEYSAPVPEPSTWLLFSLTMIFLFFFLKK
ncbi:MAG: PEP-CTERM sorting domain-containing protein [Candidatus Brocadiae bacterium]|nr:PEP-CTERM sorting domain-containing protein [Candidatus Brocadiia bacterium]